MKVGIIGVGRMGQTIAKLVIEDPGMDVVMAVDTVHNPNIGCDIGALVGKQPIGVNVSDVADIEKMIDESGVEVMIDFTIADACFKNSKILIEHGVNVVVGTTGLSDKQMESLEKLIKEKDTGAVISPNMSIGVNLFWRIVENAARMLRNYDYDAEIIEAHHKFKKDAPSGTALKTADIVAGVMADEFSQAVYGRYGEAPRASGEIGIHSIRAGDIVGEHTAIFGSIGDRIEITHRAHSRETFARGAVEAAKFIHGKKGFYSMDDVLGMKDVLGI